MRRGIQWALGAAGMTVCVGAAGHFGLVEPSCPVPGFELVDWGVFGAAGLASVALGGPNGPPKWASALWANCGGLVALVFIGVWSFAPWVLLALLAFGGAALLGGKLWSRRTLKNLLLLAATAALNFLLLFPVAKHTGVEVVELPAGSLAIHAFSRVDYADAYRAKLPPGAPYDVDSVTRVVLASLVPCWRSRALHEDLHARIQALTLQPGTPAFAKVYDRSSNEILMGADEYHLNFRLSIWVSEENGARWVTVSTVVQYNNWLGRAYFIPVRVGHQIIVPHVVRTAVHTLR